MSAAMEARIDVVRGAQERHMFARAASKDASSGEEWFCKCGEHYRGDGALEKGHRHVAAQIVEALDAVGARS